MVAHTLGVGVEGVRFSLPRYWCEGLGWARKSFMINFDFVKRALETGVKSREIIIPEKLPLKFKWSELKIVVDVREPAGRYSISNESVEQIVEALDLQRDHRVLSILGGGDQALGMLGRVDEGRIYGFDINARQIILTAVKSELIAILDCPQYLRFLQGKLQQREKETIKRYFRECPEAVRNTVDDIVDNFNLEADDDIELLGYHKDADWFQAIGRNIKNLELFQHFLPSPFHFPQHFFDRVYLSNVFDYIERENEPKLVQEIKRISKPNGQIYAATFGEKSDNLRSLIGNFKEDEKSYDRAMGVRSKGALGSKKGFGDFFIGINSIP